MRFYDLYRAKSRVTALTWRVGERSRRSQVLVDHSSEHSAASNRSTKGHDGRRVVLRRLLPEALMRPVLVKVPGIFVEDRDGVGLVDQHPVGALLPGAANEPLG